MSTENATSPDAADTSGVAAEGVADQGKSASNDDIDTEAFDRAPAPDDDNLETPRGETGDVTDSDKQTNVETFEIETEDGEKVKVPAKLKDAFLRQAAFTQKTQEVAAERRQLAEAATALATERTQQAEAFAALRADHIKVGQIESQHADLRAQADTYANVDWAALQQQDPDAYERHRAIQRQVRDSLTDAEEALGRAKTELTTKEAKRLEDAATSATADLAKRREETKAALETAIPGWDKDKATAAATIMVGEFGVTPEELAEATDHRLWSMAHNLAEARAKIATLSKTSAQQATADKHAKDQTTTPAKTPTGGAGASPRDPSKATGDGLNTPSWMDRRNRQIEAKRKRA